MSKHEGIPVPPVAMVAAGVVQRFTPKGKKCRRLRRAASVILMAASGTLLFSTFASFTRHGTTVDPTVPASASTLVTGGTNAITRNPMYAAMAGMLLAHAVSRGSWQALLPVAGFVVVADRLQIVREEHALRSLFGEAYLQYCARTPRWIGRRTLDCFKGR
ncbi:isoprenylcysteine carboxylmethyltransferase family protein [Arthrobacter sp. E3]|uniref:methyltransferase family protein n=1 Tax=Arthrobacter sp. E3 TaxID=517402 RepID=UPI001A940376|nr:isoprenylcysteine carboxylmethyltransferase family protein [Arthrobacter sp. E3]